MAEDPEVVKAAYDRARTIVTAMAEGLTPEELTEEGMAMANALVAEVEAELAAMEDPEAAAVHAGQLITALAHLAVHIAQMAPLVLNRLDNQGVEIPPGFGERFGDAQMTISTAWLLAEIDPGEWGEW